MADSGMSIGSSGRIVIEVEPEAKRQLYAALARDGLTLKNWFLKNAESYLTHGNQLPLSFTPATVEATFEVPAESSKAPTFGDRA